jgi:hypothetical protein
MGTSKKFFRARRGFTRQLHARGLGQVGYSADARVHLNTSSRTAQASRFFRARAGSPPAANAVKSNGSVLPRTRGFTGDDVAKAAVDPGSSTYARVHRPMCSRSQRCSWFLRARAGSPLEAKAGQPKPPVLPRTRGFTAGNGRAQPARRGSSAHARVQGNRPACPTGRAGLAHPALP